MDKLYWNTDRTQVIDHENIIDLYEVLIQNVEGIPYEDLKTECARLYNEAKEYEPGNEKDERYFGRIITPINFLGFLQTDEENESKVISNTFLSKNIRNEAFAKMYLDYYLAYWQYPRHNTSDDRELEVRKPYLVILKLLKMLLEQSEDEAYLTKQEFFHLFDNTLEGKKSYEDINDTLVSSILVDNRAWGRAKPPKTLSIYETSFLKYSSVLTFSSEDYDNPNDFCFGLKKGVNTLKKLKFLLSNYLENDRFYFDPAKPKTDKHVINQWALFINNKDRFKIWFNAMSLIDFDEFCRNKGFQFQDDLIRRFILSITTKPFLILTGISGSGKTKIAELYGEYLDENSRGEHYILAIGSNWNDNKKLLGIKNPLADPADAYQTTPLVEFMQKANENLDKHYVVILDEMNLSYTEKYFSDFLSALESRTHEISLPNGEKIQWTDNIKIIGTINEDETTHTISPKVLDRANVIEMNGLKPSSYIDSQIEKGTKLYSTLSSNIEINDYKTLLDNIYDSLNGNFAFRIINEISEYINHNIIYDSTRALDVLLDEQIYQKILPKIHGSKLDLPNKLEKLKGVLDSTDKPYTLTNAKIRKMSNDVSIHGYASFITG